MSGIADNIDRDLHVQYGCGLTAPSGWRNFDASPTLRLQRLPLVGGLLTRGRVVFPANVEYGDVVEGLPVPEEACAGVYCSHVLEHLALNDARKALRETRRILASGGRFRLVLPDLEQLARAYLEAEQPDAATQFMRAVLLGKEDRPRGALAGVREWLGNSGHLWMWDYKGLREELARAGFRDIRRAELGNSADAKFTEVESADRWSNCLGIECHL